MPLYFAYGSNMDQEQMAQRCPHFRLIGPAVLEDYQLAFTIYSRKRKCGCADIVPSVGDKVYGLLYELTDEDLQKLDVCEGTPNHYRRIEVQIGSGRELMTAYTYEVVNKQSNLQP